MNLEAILSDTRMDDGLADIRLRDGAGTEHQLDLPFWEIYRSCGMPNPIALDFLITASLCYLVDKTVSRKSAEDRWTRQLDVRLPVSTPHLWQGVAASLCEALQFLTGDEWSLDFYEAPQALFEPPAQKPVPSAFQADTVSLFSGGLDSLAGAIDLMAGSNSRVLLIGHYDSPGPRKVQATLAASIKQRYPGRLDMVHVRVAHRPSKAAEETLRSRSLVFLALGLFAAQGFGPKVPLYMFENGLIALNVPLTPSRQGSCSTRTMHPYYLQLIRALMPRVGIGNTVLNPYGLKTKGECVTACANRELLLELADGSVSCSHASRRQDWARKGATNCGYCIPCLFRRAAMYPARCDSGVKYGIDVLAGELEIDDQRESATDLRALTDFLRQPRTASALRRKIIATAPIDGLDAHVSMACRGFFEVNQWLESGKIK